MGGCTAIIGQHKAHRDFNILVITHNAGNLCELLAAIHNIAFAIIDLVSICNFTARFYRIVVVENWLPDFFCNHSHFMHRGYIPSLYAGFTQHLDDLWR